MLIIEVSPVPADGLAPLGAGTSAGTWVTLRVHLSDIYGTGILRVNMETSRALMEGINMEKSSQGCYKAMQLSQ